MYVAFFKNDKNRLKNDVNLKNQGVWNKYDCLEIVFSNMKKFSLHKKVK